MLDNSITYIFCTELNFTPLPTSQYILLLFAAHLALSGLAYTSIKVYFSSIGDWHTSCSQHNAYHLPLTPRLEQVLRGIKKEKGRTFPIAMQILTQIYSVLAKLPTAYQSIMLWAACCTAFFGFLRVWEMTVPSHEAYDSSVHLSIEDVAVDGKSNPTTIWLNLKLTPFAWALICA